MCPILLPVAFTNIYELCYFFHGYLRVLAQYSSYILYHGYISLNDILDGRKTFKLQIQIYECISS